MNPNPEQAAAISAHDGAIALVAGPGSGKTSVLVARHKAILDSGVRSEDVLNLTFTKSAAEEMKKRAGNKGNFSTFHSFGYKVISEVRGRPPMEPELRHRLLSKLCRKYGVDYKVLTANISRFRHQNITPEIAIDEYDYATGHSYSEYERERQAAGWIDFDSMLIDSLNLLGDPEIRARYQYRHISIDESQDTDSCQWVIAKYITEKHGNVLAVGDFNQAMYGFRNAVVDFEAHMRSIWPMCKTLYLGRNYRSSHIITTHVRENAPTKTPLNDLMLPHRSDQGAPIEYRMFHNEFDEAESSVVSANEDPLNSIVLSRTNRGLGLVENFCIENEIKYTLLGKSGFWKQPEITRTIEKLKPYSHLPLTTAMGIIMPAIEQHYRAEDATPEDNYALENVRTLCDIGKRFGLCRDFVVFANRAAHAKKQKGITLSTVHQAKGSEFKNVFVIGARDGNMPHVKGDPSEESRIWFVALSRAKDRLRFSFVGTPSPFLRRYLPEEILLTLVENAGKVERLQKQNLLF